MSQNGKKIIFFIDKEQFKTDKTEMTVRELLVDYAKENPEETTLVEIHGNQETQHTDLNEVIQLKNGMKFVVFHNGPTPVSMR